MRPISRIRYRYLREARWFKIADCLFVCLVSYLLMWLQPLAAYLRNCRERDFNHPCPVAEQARPISSKVVTMLCALAAVDFY